MGYINYIYHPFVAAIVVVREAKFPARMNTPLQWIQISRSLWGSARNSDYIWISLSWKRTGFPIILSAIILVTHNILVPFAFIGLIVIILFKITLSYLHYSMKILVLTICLTIVSNETESHFY